MTAIPFAVISTPNSTPEMLTVLCLFASALYLTLSAITIKILCWVERPPRGCISKQPAVKPVHAKQTFFGKTLSSQFSFANPFYIEQLERHNTPEVLRVDEAELQRQIALYDQEHGL